MNMLQQLCTKFVERSEALGLKGKKREDACFEFMCGAATALQAVGHPEADHVTKIVAMLISVRGYGEVVNIANKAKEQAAA